MSDHDETPRTDAGPGPMSGDNLSASMALQAKALEEIPEASSSNVRGRCSYDPYPMIYMERGDGATLTDVDGNEYVDFHCGISAIIAGHNPPRQQEAVEAQLDRGPYFATTYKLEYETAELLNDLLPGSDKTKFISTGTEAIMSALKLARAYTGKEKVLKFEGMYHGHTDYMEVNIGTHPSDLGTRRNPSKVAGANGVPADTLETTLCIPWNDLDLLAETLERHGNEIAAVITEGLLSNNGSLWPDDGYLDGVRRLTAEHDVLFILDEVVTGFRMGLDGAQGYFDVEPDLAIYGKALANGYPCAAVTGRDEVMEFISGSSETAGFMGTFSGNPLVVSAVNANLELLRDLGEDAYDELERKGDRLQAGLQEIGSDAGHAVHVPDFAGFSWMHFVDPGGDPSTWSEYRDVASETQPEKFETFAAGMIDEGIFLPPRHGRINLMHAHTDEHIDQFLEAAKSAIKHVD